MKFRVLVIAIALIALTTVAFSQPATVIFYYRGMGECAGGTPITGSPCWAGTPIPDGTGGLHVIVNGVESTCPAVPTWTFNGSAVCVPGAPGFFFPDAYCTGHNSGDAAHMVVVTNDSCTYTGENFALAAGANDIFMYEDDWASCNCKQVGCEVKEEFSGILKQETNPTE